MPSNGMLAVPTKGSAGILDIKEPIQKYIVSEFGRASAEDGASVLNKAQKLRNDAAEMAGGANEVQSALLGYYRFLTALEAALPVGKERGGIPLRFKWTDAFQPDRGDGRSDIIFEKAALLFNLGAINSQVALGADLGSEKGVRAAAKNYQEAAGFFAYIGEHLVPRLDKPYPTDLSPETCGMLSTLCLSQAQECFYTKAAHDRKTPALLARIACQVAEQYRELNSIQLSDQLKRELGKPFMAHLSIKSTFFQGLTLVHQAQVFIADDECGEQIACLKEAERLLNAARKEGTGWIRVDDELIAKIDSALDDVRITLTKAERENTSLYFQRVPPISDVASPAPASLVNPIAPPKDIDSVDPVWFGFLDDANRSRSQHGSAAKAFVGEPDDTPTRMPSSPVSRGTSVSVGNVLGKLALGAAKGVAGWAVDSMTNNDRAQAAAAADSRNVAQMYDAPRQLSASDLFGSDSSSNSSARSPRRDEPLIDSHKYVEEVRTLIREAMDTIATANSQRDEAMQRFGLPGVLDAVGGDKGRTKLQGDLSKQIDGYRHKGGIQHLVQMLDDIQMVRDDSIQQLDRIEAQLNAEAKEDEAARNFYGSKWPMQESSFVNANLRDRLAGYRDNLRDAGKSDGKLKALVEDNAAQFAALGLGTLPGRFGGKQGTWRSSGEDDDIVETMAKVRSDVAEVDNLTRQRSRLHDAFKSLWNNDVIIQKQGKYLEWELDQGYNKYEDARDALDRNSKQQQQVLERLEGDMRHFSHLATKTQHTAEDAAATVKRFGNVEKSLAGGHKFYSDLQRYIQSLDKETDEYLAQRYAEGKDAVTLMERNSRPSDWGSTPSTKSSGGMWPFGGSSSSSSSSSGRKSRWAAVPQQSGQMGGSPVRLRHVPHSRRKFRPAVPRCHRIKPQLQAAAAGRAVALCF